MLKKTQKKRENPCESYLNNSNAWGNSTTSKQPIRFGQTLTAEFTIFNILLNKEEKIFFTETEQQIHGIQYHTKFLSFLYISLVDLLGREGANTSETEFSSGE